MRDYLLDIVKYNKGIGNIKMVKLISDENETRLEARADESVVVSARYKTAIPGLTGTLGIGNLDALQTITSIREYDENAKITVTTKTDAEGNEFPFTINFENSSGDFKNVFRLMTEKTVSEQIKSVRFKGASWDVEFEPSQIDIQRFKYQSVANSEETVFLAKTVNGDLKFFFGDGSGNTGDFVFKSQVKGELTQGWRYPVTEFLNALNLPGKITMKFSDQGAAIIEVDNDLAVYEYIFPAQTK